AIEVGDAEPVEIGNDGPRVVERELLVELDAIRCRQQVACHFAPPSVTRHLPLLSEQRNAARTPGLVRISSNVIDILRIQLGCLSGPTPGRFTASISPARSSRAKPTSAAGVRQRKRCIAPRSVASPCGAYDDERIPSR